MARRLKRFFSRGSTPRLQASKMPRIVSKPPFFYIPGPTFNQNAAEQAMYQTKVAKPAERILGMGYPTMHQPPSMLQPVQSFAQPATTLQGIGIQQGIIALPPLSNPDGTPYTANEENMESVGDESTIYD
jgi:hypothetical protein